MGSTSLGGTIASILSLRIYNFLTPTLLIVWALSPLGGQSSLHLMGAGTRQAFSNVNITYFDTRSESVFSQNGQAADVYLPTTNAIFQASLMEPPSAKSSRQDLWSNVKIPNLASLATTPTLNSPTWINFTAEQDLAYSSLLGIPISGLPLDGRTTLMLESSYFTLTQDNTIGNITNFAGNDFKNETQLNTVKNGTWHWANSEETEGLAMAIDGYNIAEGDYSLWWNVYDKYSPNTEFSPEAARRIAIESDIFNYHRFYTLSTTYIETSILCSGLPVLCQPTAIRHSQQPHLNPNITNLAYMDTWSAFGSEMLVATALDQSGMPTITEAFMNNPATVAATSVSFGASTYVLTATDAELQIRAQQLLNTYWQASVNPAVTIAGLNKEADEMDNIRTRSAMGIHETSTNIYVVNWAWWVAFTSATSIMLALACLALMVDYFLRGPEILGHCLALLRDSPFAETGRGVGSAMGGSERVRRWGDVEVKLVDVRAGEDVGYIAVAEVERARAWSTRLLKGGRLYA
jgi:hypothetical protein